MSHAHGEPRRTLIADDVPGLRRLVHIMLELEAGYEVAGEAADGGEAVEQARELRPDLVLLDLSMPTMDGWRPCSSKPPPLAPPPIRSTLSPTADGIDAAK